MSDNIFIDKLRHKLAERGYAGEALEAKVKELLARPLPPALAELMQRQKRERDAQIAKINSLEPIMESLTDEELRQQTESLKNRFDTKRKINGL